MMGNQLGGWTDELNTSLGMNTWHSGSGRLKEEGNVYKC